MSERLRDVEILITFNEKVRRESIEDLVWIFIYNLTLVSIAMGNLYHEGIILRPEMAVIIMITSEKNYIVKKHILEIAFKL
jgi:cation transport ATPase